LMKSVLAMTPPEMADVFDEWNKGELDSFLIEITANIMRFQDEHGDYLVEKIRDSAGQKGTGKWTAIAALDYGVPVTLIGEAVFARCLSSLQSERIEASKTLPGPAVASAASAAYPAGKERVAFIEAIRRALYASKIVSYAQGFMLLREAAKQYNWQLNYGGIALMWRGGCIIRSVFLGNIKLAFERNADLKSLLMDDFFRSAVGDCQQSWRDVIAAAAKYGVPVPAFSTALSFYDAYRCQRLPANLIQAQRDYFGAHTYELLAQPGVFHHANWTGHGGRTSASTYQA